MKRFVSMRKKFQLAILGIVATTLATLACIVFLVFSHLIQRFNDLNDQEDRIELERLQKDSEELQAHFIELYTANLLSKSATLLNKDSIAIRTPFIENSVTYIRDFLIDSLRQDTDIWSASFIVADPDSIKAWQYVDRNFPEGLGFQINYERNSKSWISQINGRRVKAYDPHLLSALNAEKAEITKIRLELAGKVIDAYQATIPIYDGDLQQLKSQGEAIGFLRYILSLEGLQREVEREHARLSERLQRQHIEQENAKQERTLAAKRMLWLSLAFLGLGGLFVTILGIWGAAFVSHKLTHSLQTLIKGTHQVAAGDLSTAVVVESDDEIGLLGEAFDQMRIDLAEKERSRTLFFHNTSHELRTPLNGIMGYLDLTCQGRFGEISDHTRNQLLKALRLAESLKYQVNTILDLAKSKKGELELQNSQIDLALLKRDAENLAEGLLLKSENCSFTSELILSHDDHHFISDREKIFTILRNLLGNAFKFRDPVRNNYVELSIRRESSALRITVEDSGIGIPESHLHKIFEEFSQVEGDARRNYEGTGLGLALVKGIVEALQGTVTAESNLGKGSRFTVSIPEQAEISVYTAKEDSLQFTSVARPDASSPKENPLPERRPQNSKNGEGFQVLVIDDNLHNCDVISETLSAEGYLVKTSLSGHRGLQLMEEAKPDILLLDMMMPGMSGEDVLKAMKQSSNLGDIPVILITARASDEDRIIGLKMGADDYLAKPIIPDEMLLRVKNLLDRKQLTQRLQKEEFNTRMIQLGEMFGDLSHEIKNILQNSGDSLHASDVSMLFLATVIPEEQRDLVATAAVGEIAPGYMDRMDLLELPQQSPNRATLRKLRALIAELNLENEVLLSLWQRLINEQEVELIFLENMLKIISNYKMAVQLNRRTRDLSLAVLDFTREDETLTIAHFGSALKQAKLILHTRINRAACRIQVQENRDFNVSISPGALIQILINLITNALDALQSLPADQRWIRIEAQTGVDPIIIAISNAGAPIPPEIAERIFERGFSTKGSQGSGIGLYLSQKLARQVDGDLRLNQNHAHPCFEILLGDSHIKEGSIKDS